ncbi:MAG: efflux transporter outer membrane subunit [Pseudomonadota bacterium]
MDTLPKGEWWRIFGDEELNRLEQQALAGNFSLQAAVARLERSRALTQTSRAGLFPSIDLDGKSTRTRASANRPSASNNGNVNSSVQNDYALGFVVNYEANLFGRISRDVEASSADEQQAAADLENVRLLLTSDVAANYFSLRALEGEIAIIEENITVQTHALDVVRARHDDGIDLAQQELLVSGTRSQWQQLLRQSAQQRHALATLLGVTINNFVLATKPLPEKLPQIPLALPADLLQRRPDIASAERAVAAANARIGVARAAWFPHLNLSATEGMESSHLNTLFGTPSLAWSLGLALSQTLFDGGRNQAKVNYANSVHQQATASYRQTVLKAWQEVEDGLAGSRILAAARNDAFIANRAADRVADITEQRYQAGLVGAIERYTARQNALIAQREVQRLAGQQWVNAVYLVKALGGGWDPL